MIVSFAPFKYFATTFLFFLNHNTFSNPTQTKNKSKTLKKEN